MPRIPQHEFIRCYKFKVSIGGVMTGMAEVSEIEKMISRNGQVHCKPVTFMNALKEGCRSFAEVIGNRPWEKRDITISELTMDGEVVRTIFMKKCKFLSFKTGKHAAMEEDVLVEWVKVRPLKIHVRHNIKLVEDPVAPRVVQAGLPNNNA